ncbi:MAG: hypothetical protein NUV52_02165 [Candidatus Roizmanbacteria bacterium]|nr:hypothetical protein [Candidatus Roizmanbacteria bacterium]
MVRARIHIILVLTIVMGIWFRMSEFTDADISDQVIVPGNRISMMSISLSSTKTVDGMRMITLLQTEGLLPEGFDVGAIRVTQDSSSASLPYRLTAHKKNGDDGLCNALALRVYRTNEIAYQGNLIDVSLSSSIELNGRDDWIFVVSLPSHNTDLKNKLCSVDFVFSTKKDGQQGGLYGESHVGSIISTGTW